MKLNPADKLVLFCVASTNDAPAVTDPFQSSRRPGRWNAFSKLASSTITAVSATGTVCGELCGPGLTSIFWSLTAIAPRGICAAGIATMELNPFSDYGVLL